MGPFLWVLFALLFFRILGPGNCPCAGHCGPYTTFVGHTTHIGNRRGANRALVGKLWAKRPLQIPRCRWEDNIKMDNKEIRWNYTDWINLSCGRYKWRLLLNIIIRLQVPQNAENFPNNRGTSSFSISTTATYNN